MDNFRCLDCETEITEDESVVNRAGGHPCPTCGLRGEWVYA